MALTLYGISTCGTVKKAKTWLTSREVSFEWVDFRKTPPEAARVERWVQALGAKAMRNTSGGAYRALGEEKKTWTDEQWASAFKADPMLIKRPIIERDERPVQVGFRGTDEDFEARLLGE